MRNKFDKYHEKMKALYKENVPFIEDMQLDQYTKYLISRVKKEESFHLYRYTNDIHLEALDELYLGNNGAMNDIYEGLPKTELDCNQLREIMPKIKKWVYMKCFTESYDNNLMWAHYANNSKGVCVEYDIKKMVDSSYVISNLYPVVYSKERLLSIDLEGLSQYLDGTTNEDWLTDTKGMFVQKDYIWRYEKEWRIVLTKPLVEKYKLPKAETGDGYIMNCPYISAIYMGVDISSANADRIIQQYGNIAKVYQMKVDANSYKLVCERVS